MTRQSQVAQKSQRAVQDLDAYCRQVERLARRMSRIVTKAEPDAEDAAAIAPLDPALARLNAAMHKLNAVTPVTLGECPAAGDAEEDDEEFVLRQAEALVNDPDCDRFIEALTNLATDTADDLSPSSERQPGMCVLRGMSPSLTVPTVLEFLAMQRKTGALRVQATGENFSIEICDGRIVHAVSDARPEDERLGNILLRRGLIGAEQLQNLLSTDDQTVLGAQLYREDLVSREDLLSALEEQASLLFRRLFAHRETGFAFYEGEATNNEIQIEANVTTLLLEGARGNDESQNQPSQDWEDWLK